MTHDAPPTHDDDIVKVLALGLVLCLFLFRPSALGHRFVPLGLIVVVFLTSIFVVHVRFRIQTTKEARDAMLWIAALWGAFIAYEVGIALIQRRTDVLQFTKDTVTALVAITCYGLFLAVPRNNRLFFRYFSTVVAVLGWSCVVTILLFQVLDANAIHLFDIAIRGYEGSGQSSGDTGRVYFPLSMLYQDMPLPGVHLARFCGFFTEAGLFQAAACFSFLWESFTRRSRWVRCGHVAAAILSFSTIGIVMLVFSLGLAYVARHPLRLKAGMAGIAVLALAFYAALYTPRVGLVDKSTLGASSIDDRTWATETGLRRAMENPWGDGPFSSTTLNSTITLLAATGALGFIGVLLQMVILSGVRGWPTRRDLRAYIVCTPLLLTAIVAQPLAGTAMAYVLVMVRVPSNEPTTACSVRSREALRNA